MKFALIILFFALRILPVYADSTNVINSTIQISVCGNDIIEGGEDCEKENLNGKTCQALGFGPGTLSCDIACSFVTSSCSPAPTPSPTPTPTVTPAPTSTSLAVTNTPAPQATNTSAPTPIPTPVIPAVVAVFDLNRSGKIEVSEVFSAINLWVDEWSQAINEKVTTRKCDVNRDSRCDLLDLSIILYYVGR